MRLRSRLTRAAKASVIWLDVTKNGRTLPALADAGLDPIRNRMSLYHSEVSRKHQMKIDLWVLPGSPGPQPVKAGHEVSFGQDGGFDEGQISFVQANIKYLGNDRAKNHQSGPDQISAERQGDERIK